MTIDLSAISGAVGRIEQVMGSLEKDLNAADAKLGDGDTGTMLARVVRAIARLDFDAMEDIGSAFTQMGKAAAMATGSSLGTLISTGFLTIGRESGGASNVDPTDFAEALAEAVEAMKKRGGASIGDKTVLDSLSEIVFALRGMGTDSSAACVAADAAEKALLDFRDRSNRVGRARVYGEKSVGLDDPGMLAAAKVARTIAG